MTDFISSLKKTRKTASDILVAALSHSDGKTEKEIRDTILETVAAHDELFPMGWYDPPPGGVAVLSSSSPYRRLQFDTLREENYWPGSDGVIGGENVSLVYISPVDRKTGMFGDIGLTLFTRNGPAISADIRSCRNRTSGNEIFGSVSFFDRIIPESRGKGYRVDDRLSRPTQSQSRAHRSGLL